jgi:hypothetical protein
MAHQQQNASQAIIDAAYEAFTRGDAGGEHRLAILICESNLRIIALLEKLNGNGRRKRDRIKAAALPAGGGMGLLAIVEVLVRSA